MTDYNEIFRKEIMNDTFCDVATYYSHYFESEYYKKMSRLWKRAAKKEKAKSDKWLELLRRSYDALKCYQVSGKIAISEWIIEDLEKELARELGDDNDNQTIE